MTDEIMDSEARERLIRIETIQSEQGRVLIHVAGMAESVVRLQEGEKDQNAKINVLFDKSDKHGAAIDGLRHAHYRSMGAMTVFAVVVLPIIGFILETAYTSISGLDRRTTRLETQIMPLLPAKAPANE